VLLVYLPLRVVHLGGFIRLGSVVLDQSGFILARSFLRVNLSLVLLKHVDVLFLALERLLGEHIVLLSLYFVPKFSQALGLLLVQLVL
jgi:hypothetical protein